MSLLELLKYIFLGVIQGFTEILPISSSGHVGFFQVIFNLQTESGLFLSSLLNLGSFIAIVVFFRTFLWKLIKSFLNYVFKNDRDLETVMNFKYVMALMISTIPVAFVGLLFRDELESLYSENLMIIIGVGFFVAATLLFAFKDVVNKHVTKKVSYKDGFIIGLLQPIALIPGLSRLALTTVAGLHRKKSMETSLTFAILLGLPIALGELILGTRQLILNPQQYFGNMDTTLWLNYIYIFFAFAASILVTLFALKNIFIWARKGRFGFFAIYNALIGLIAFAYGILNS